jgi:hypothetical protein
MPAAMAVEAIVGPARPATDRRTPERPAKHGADDAADHGARRPGDHEAGARTCRRAHHVGARAQRSRRDGGKDGCCQDKLTHHIFLLLLLATPRYGTLPTSHSVLIAVAIENPRLGNAQVLVWFTIADAPFLKVDAASFCMVDEF